MDNEKKEEEKTPEQIRADKIADRQKEMMLETTLAEVIYIGNHSWEFHGSPYDYGDKITCSLKEYNEMVQHKDFQDPEEFKVITKLLGIRDAGREAQRIAKEKEEEEKKKKKKGRYTKEEA